MAGTKPGEATRGESVFADPNYARGREGRLLRDRGYAESSPVAWALPHGRRMACLLTTAYENHEFRLNSGFWVSPPPT